jgi:hypothetical protein
MKTNVRQHTRHTKHKVADVTEHTRRIKDRQVVAVIPIKNLKYKQAKAIFPRLNPNGDYDRDGVKNKKDCRPFDAMRQDDEEDEWERNREEIKNRALERRNESIKKEQEEKVIFLPENLHENFEDIPYMEYEKIAKIPQTPQTPQKPRERGNLFANLFKNKK